MKKLGVSLIAILLGLPVVAQADIANASTVTATTNTDVATTSFVAGAYNAAISEINTSRAQINANTTAIAAKPFSIVMKSGASVFLISRKISSRLLSKAEPFTITLMVSIPVGQCSNGIPFCAKT